MNKQFLKNKQARPCCSMDMSLSKLRELVMDREARRAAWSRMESQRVGHD